MFCCGMDQEKEKGSKMREHVKARAAEEERDVCVCIYTCVRMYIYTSLSRYVQIFT
jgi:hypothetical protein